MKILVINAGSSSLKYQFIDMVNNNVLAKGLCDRIGISQGFLRYKGKNSDMVTISCDIPNHEAAMRKVIEILTSPDTGVISDISEIDAVGHRVVHGGENFSHSALIDEETIKAIRSCISLAVLHNPANLTGIEACKRIMPNVPMVAVFDTAFHQTIPEFAYIYPLPYEAYTEHKVRKYGFHGTSHKYVSGRASKMLNRPIEQMKIVSCHLGNGASVCAIKNGKSVDTSMGLTPLAGLAMGTRCGDIDPSVLLFLMEKGNMSIDDMSNYLNKHSGVLGISGVSSDFRDIESAMNEGDHRAKLSIDVFCYTVKKYIGQYSAVLGGIDTLVFTAGIGENNGLIRERIVEHLEYLGVKIDPAKNEVKGKEMDISAQDASVKTLVIPTNEELGIAIETMRLIKV